MRVCAFYSKGRRYLDVLRWVRAHYADAQLVALAPPSYHLPDEERAAADVVAATEMARYSAKSPAAFLRLVCQLRRERYGVFVITFDSPRLRILAALSGANRCAYCSMDGHVVPIRPTVLGTAASTLARNAWGRMAYAGIWVAVRLFKVGAR